ncbi:MAG: hypothetical protein QN183_15110 [Armatimonadota bacterium]|nr:hypothetical protein [Armatimonadota bacterium]
MGWPDLMSGGIADHGVWPEVGLEIPQASPAAVARPPVREWLERARQNREALDGAAVEIAGVPLGVLRRTARVEALARAADYTRRLGIAVESGRTGVLLATGHQPVFVHPGIWIKYLALARVVPQDGMGLAIIVDSDAADEIAVEVPHDDGRLRRTRVPLARGGPTVPFELLPAPTEDDWRRLATSVDAYLATLGSGPIAEAWGRARALWPPRSPGGLAGAITALRRRLEGPRAYVDLPVSVMSGMPAFRRFALAIMRDAVRFAEIHNACLDAYREHYGIRTAAQPFPDLTIAPDRVEVPFWYLADGQRWPVFVEPASRAIAAGHRVVGRLPEDPDEPAFAAMPLRPRALTLTAFVRLAICDLFIHGVGGARYDRATDAVVRAFFGIAPPAYAAATATLFLPFASGGSVVLERQRLARRLLDLQHNPERFLVPEGAHRVLVEEKWALIRQLEQAAALTRRERRAATRRIRELNAILRVAVADQVAEVQAALDRLNHLQADADVAAHRGYPFVLHRVEDVEAVVDLLVSDDAASTQDPSAR